MIDHVSIQCADLETSVRFYSGVLRPLGLERIAEVEGAIGYGLERPDVWLRPCTSSDAPPELHLAFRAADQFAVQAFFDAAVTHGTDVIREPQESSEYGSVN